MTFCDIGFYFLGGGILGTSFLFLSLKNPIRILVCFSLLMMQIAATMILLDAVLIALFFLVFYTALISIFLVFYMVTQNHSTAHISPLSAGYKWLTFLVTVLLGGQTFFMLVYKVRPLFQELPQDLGNLEFSPRILGELIYNDYPLLMMCLGVLFFSTFIGIILIMGLKKHKLSKLDFFEKIQRDLNSVELKEVRFSHSSSGARPEQTED